MPDSSEHISTTAAEFRRGLEFYHSAASALTERLCLDLLQRMINPGTPPDNTEHQDEEFNDLLSHYKNSISPDNRYKERLVELFLYNRQGVTVVRDGFRAELELESFKLRVPPLSLSPYSTIETSFVEVTNLLLAEYRKRFPDILGLYAKALVAHLKISLYNLHTTKIKSLKESLQDQAVQKEAQSLWSKEIFKQRPNIKRLQDLRKESENRAFKGILYFLENICKMKRQLHSVDPNTEGKEALQCTIEAYIDIFTEKNTSLSALKSSYNSYSALFYHNFSIKAEEDVFQTMKGKFSDIIAPLGKELKECHQRNLRRKTRGKAGEAVKLNEISDVLFRQGGGGNANPGNDPHLAFVELLSPEYRKAREDRDLQDELAELVEDTTHFRGGRFLLEEKGRYEEVPADLLRKKTKQQLRERGLLKVGQRILENHSCHETKGLDTKIRAPKRKRCTTL